MSEKAAREDQPPRESVPAPPSTSARQEVVCLSTMSSTTFVDRIDPFAKRSLKKKSKKSQGASRYRNSVDVELQQLPQLKGAYLMPCLFAVQHFRRRCTFFLLFFFANSIISWAAESPPPRLHRELVVRSLEGTV